MKNTFLLVLLFLSTMMHSQIVDLQKLSSGKLISSSVLQNREADDLYGYFYVFEDDKIDKTHTQFSYVLLDKNLNNVAKGKFVETHGNNLKSTVVNSSYRDNNIAIQITHIWKSSGTKELTTYRLFDLKANKLSDPFSIDDNANKNYKIDETLLKEPFTFFYNLNPFGYSVNTPIKYSSDNYMSPNYKLTNKDKDVPNRLHFVSPKLEPLWVYEYAKVENKDKYIAINFLNTYNTTNDLIATKEYRGDGYRKDLKNDKVAHSYIFFDKQTGKVKNEFSPFGVQQVDGVTAKEIDNIAVIQKTTGKVTFIDRLRIEKQPSYAFDFERIMGFSKVEYDIEKGKVISRNFFLWKQLSKYLSIDEYGYVKEQGEPNSYLHTHAAVQKSNGNLLLIMEQYKPLKVNIGGLGVKINDMFFIELDTKMQVVNFKRVSKDSAVYKNGNGVWGLEAALRYNAFDYSGYQNLGKDNYAFFYFNKQRPEGGGKKTWILGIVTYMNGAFKEEKLTLKSKDESELMIYPAKKGYIMITEKFKDESKGLEVRLEKMN